jgi:hypothetical protein
MRPRFLIMLTAGAMATTLSLVGWSHSGNAGSVAPVHVAHEGAAAATAPSAASTPVNPVPANCLDRSAHCSPAEIVAAQRSLAQPRPASKPEISNADAISRISNMPEFRGASPTRTEIKRTTEGEALRAFGGPEWSPDDSVPVVVVAVSGDILAVPFGAPSLAPTGMQQYDSAIYVLQAAGGDLVTYQFFPAAWPPGFDALRRSGTA